MVDVQWVWNWEVWIQIDGKLGDVVLNWNDFRKNVNKIAEVGSWVQLELARRKVWIFLGEIHKYGQLLFLKVNHRDLEVFHVRNSSV